MKRAIVALCALAFVAAMSSCKKENEDIDTTTDNETSYEDPAYVEGVFNPGRHIATFVGPGVSEQWSWSNESTMQLTGIADVVNSSSYNFSYKGSGRMASSTYTKGSTTKSYTFDYDEGYLDEITTRKNNAVWLKGNVSHSGGNISRIDYTDLSIDFVKTMASLMLGRDLDDVSFNLDDPSFVVNYNWSGKNVVSEDYEASVTGSMTTAQLYSVFGDDISDGGLGQYAALLPLLLQNMDDSAYAYTVDVDASIQYTYDSHHNPYYGFWGDGLLMNTKVLSANNITAATITGSVRFVSSITLQLPSDCPDWVPSQYQAFWTIIRALLNGYEIPIDQTIPLDQVQSYTYKYTSAGTPTSYTTEDDETFTFTYKEN